MINGKKVREKFEEQIRDIADNTGVPFDARWLPIIGPHIEKAHEAMSGLLQKELSLVALMAARTAFVQYLRTSDLADVVIQSLSDEEWEASKHNRADSEEIVQMSIGLMLDISLMPVGDELVLLGLRMRGARTVQEALLLDPAAIMPVVCGITASKKLLAI